MKREAWKSRNGKMEGKKPLPPSGRINDRGSHHLTGSPSGQDPPWPAWGASFDVSPQIRSDPSGVRGGSQILPRLLPLPTAAPSPHPPHAPPLVNPVVPSSPLQAWRLSPLLIDGNYPPFLLIRLPPNHRGIARPIASWKALPHLIRIAQSGNTVQPWCFSGVRASTLHRLLLDSIQGLNTLARNPYSLTACKGLNLRMPEIDYSDTVPLLPPCLAISSIPGLSSVTVCVPSNFVLDQESVPISLQATYTKAHCSQSFSAGIEPTLRPASPLAAHLPAYHAWLRELAPNSGCGGFPWPGTADLPFALPKFRYSGRQSEDQTTSTRRLSLPVAKLALQSQRLLLALHIYRLSCLVSDVSNSSRHGRLMCRNNQLLETSGVNSPWRRITCLNGCLESSDPWSASEDRPSATFSLERPFRDLQRLLYTMVALGCRWLSLSATALANDYALRQIGVIRDFRRLSNPRFPRRNLHLARRIEVIEQVGIHDGSTKCQFILPIRRTITSAGACVYFELPKHSGCMVPERDAEIQPDFALSIVMASDKLLDEAGVAGETFTKAPWHQASQVPKTIRTLVWCEDINYVGFQSRGLTARILIGWDGTGFSFASIQGCLIDTGHAGLSANRAEATLGWGGCVIEEIHGWIWLLIAHSGARFRLLPAPLEEGVVCHTMMANAEESEMRPSHVLRSYDKNNFGRNRNVVFSTPRKPERAGRLLAGTGREPSHALLGGHRTGAASPIFFASFTRLIDEIRTRSPHTLVSLACVSLQPRQIATPSSHNPGGFAKLRTRQLPISAGLLVQEVSACVLGSASGGTIKRKEYLSFCLSGPRGCLNSEIMFRRAHRAKDLAPEVKQTDTGVPPSTLSQAKQPRFIPNDWTHLIYSIVQIQSSALPREHWPLELTRQATGSSNRNAFQVGQRRHAALPQTPPVSTSLATCFVALAIDFSEITTPILIGLGVSSSTYRFKMLWRVVRIEAAIWRRSEETQQKRVALDRFPVADTEDNTIELQRTDYRHCGPHRHAALRSDCFTASEVVMRQDLRIRAGMPIPGKQAMADALTSGEVVRAPPQLRQGEKDWQFAWTERNRNAIWQSDLCTKHCLVAFAAAAAAAALSAHKPKELNFDEPEEFTSCVPGPTASRHPTTEPTTPWWPKMGYGKGKKQPSPES
ncbi:uncharacterized protein CLUP02_17527 [Colletotrichum lupini]|uniref:Uncharacterized protein n=1 Tax=Colletotrichum lupini TaxID=145971 RepID=A0A9Q8SEQ5_9PEZI|nr:uncharacterized protein CLUP02_17527 [Colletotrichum lupini]UQC76017.1 hypothetical protein CLUP02_17527 [Colletotrichum lupini]